jgi:hypothetical protein
MTAVTGAAELLLAHGLFPEFPSLGVLACILLAGGAVFALVASRRSKHVAGDADPSATTVGTSPGTSWLRIPVVTAIACGLAVPLWLVPGINVIASLVLMPGWIGLWMLLMSGVLPDHSEPISFVVMAAVSWVVWTASALIIARVVSSFRTDAPGDSTITSIRYH